MFESAIYRLFRLMENNRFAPPAVLTFSSGVLDISDACPWHHSSCPRRREVARRWSLRRWRWRGRRTTPFRGTSYTSSTREKVSHSCWTRSLARVFEADTGREKPERLPGGGTGPAHFSVAIDRSCQGQSYMESSSRPLRPEPFLAVLALSAFLPRAPTLRPVALPR